MHRYFTEYISSNEKNCKNRLVHHSMLHFYFGMYVVLCCYISFIRNEYKLLELRELILHVFPTKLKRALTTSPGSAKAAEIENIVFPLTVFTRTYHNSWCYYILDADFCIAPLNYSMQITLTYHMLNIIFL